MRILLASSASYVPPRGGSTRSNLVWLEHLAAHGHPCRVVASSADRNTSEKQQLVARELSDQQVEAPTALEGAEFARHGQIEVFSVLRPSQRAEVLRAQIREFQPDWVLVSSEDLGQVLLREAQASAPGRVVYLAHTPQFYPFGPASWSPNREGTELASQCAAIVAIGQTTAAYIHQHSGRRPEVIHPPIYGSEPFPMLANFEEGFLTLINPCKVKGITIFLALAKRLPDLKFAAVPGWGTTSADRAQLEALPNVTVLPNVKNIDQIFARTKILLAPSLWLEGFGLVVTEAMLRGIPVVASAEGGLLEAKLGTQFSIPVRPIQAYLPEFDEKSMPRAVLPEQDLEPWVNAVSRLAADADLYHRQSQIAQEAAIGFVRGLNAGRLEQLLLSLAPRPAAVKRPSGSVLDHLSPEKRALLLNRLKSSRS